MEAGGAPADPLLQHPWVPVTISGCQLLAKSWFGDTAYHVLLTDLSCVWEERMDSAAIQSRAQVQFCVLSRDAQTHIFCFQYRFNISDFKLVDTELILF